MKLSKRDLIEAKFVVPKDKVKDFDRDMEQQYEDDDVVQVVDENKFVVPSDKVKDFDKNMGQELDSDDTIQVYDESDPNSDKISKVLTKEELTEGIRSAIDLIKKSKKPIKK